MKTKTYELEYEEYMEEGKTAKELFEQILSDKELPELEEIVIGVWGEAFDDDCQPIIDGIIENKEKFSNLKSLFIGAMDFEECEISWIQQGNYDGLLQALPNLEMLGIKGSQQLELGKLESENLKQLEIICGGLPSEVLESIQQAKLPNLQKLNLYLGVEDYGCDIEKKGIEAFLKESKFPNLKYLGLKDSVMQNEVVDLVCHSDYMKQLETIDFSEGTLDDKGGQIILETVPKYPNIKKIDMHYHFMSDEMMKKLQELSCEVDLSDGQGVVEDEEELWPLVTE